MTALAEWHTARNAEVFAAYADRASRFGLRPTVSPDLPSVIHRLAARTVWAWQPGTYTAAHDAPVMIRIGFAGRRLLLGHLSLARDVAQFAEKGYLVSVVAHPQRSPESAVALRTLVERIERFGGQEPAQVVDLDADVRVFEEQVLGQLTLGRMQQVYGWTGATSLRLLQDAATMMSFFLHRTTDGRTSVALVDAGQMAHTALLRTVARRLALPMPYVAYRRMLLNLRSAAGRASVKDPKSTIYLDDVPDAARSKFLAAVTGGRASAEQQRSRGGNPTACPAFEVIELLCAPHRATEVARRCRAGEVLCQPCKNDHADEIVAAISPANRPSTPLRAGTSTAVAAALLDVAPTLHRPPSRSPAGLEEQIARYAGVLPEQVVVGSGATEILEWIMREQSMSGRAVLATTPTFELYEQLARVPVRSSACRSTEVAGRWVSGEWIPGRLRSRHR